MREAEANATQAARDVERLRGLLAKDEVSQQQFDAAGRPPPTRRRPPPIGAVAGRRGRGRHPRGREPAGAGARRRAAGAGRRCGSAQTAPEQVAAIARARGVGRGARRSRRKATLAQAELNLQYTTRQGAGARRRREEEREPGQVVQPGQPLLALVQIDDVWVTANFKETQLSDMRPGQRATIEVDAYGGREFKGKVDSIAAATGARFSLLPPENATGNFVKVVQRVPGEDRARRRPGSRAPAAARACR